MTNHTELLEQSFEINLNNFGPEDVERLNDWSIKAHDALQSAQAEIERHKLHIKHIGNDALRTENAELRARLATTEGANSMLMGRNKWLEHVLEVQPIQAPTCDLRGIDAGPLSEWVDLVRRGYVAEDECLIAVKDVPKCLAQNQPSQAVELSDVTILKIATQSKVPTVVINEVVIQFARNLFAAINAKE